MMPVVWGILNALLPWIALWLVFNIGFVLGALWNNSVHRYDERAEDLSNPNYAEAEEL